MPKAELARPGCPSLGSAPAPGAIFRALAENFGRNEISQARLLVARAGGWARGRTQLRPGRACSPIPVIGYSQSKALRSEERSGAVAATGVIAHALAENFGRNETGQARLLVARAGGWARGRTQLRPGRACSPIPVIGYSQSKALRSEERSGAVAATGVAARAALRQGTPSSFQLPASSFSPNHA